MDTMENIMTRRSTKAYTGEPVTDRELETIIRAGMQSTSAFNSRPWCMVTVQNRDTLNTMIGYTPWWKMLGMAAAAIVVCGDLKKTEKMSREFIVDSCAASAMSMILAARAIGLGAGWLGMVEGQEHHDDLKALLGIPEDYAVMSVISVGHAAEEKPAEDRFEREKWHREAWGNR